MDSEYTTKLLYIGSDSTDRHPKKSSAGNKKKFE